MLKVSWVKYKVKSYRSWLTDIMTAVMTDKQIPLTPDIMALLHHMGTHCVCVIITYTFYPYSFKSLHSSSFI